MLVFGVTIAIIFIMLFFFAFRLVSKALYVMFLTRFIQNTITHSISNMMPKGANQDES